MTRPRFADAHAEVWQALVHAAGLEREGWSGERVDVEAAGWTLTLDSFHVPVEKHHCTRMVTALPSVDLRFRVAEPDAFSWIGTLFGLFDIEIGDEAFDRRWLIKSSSPTRIRELLRDADLRRQIDALEHGSLALEGDLGRPDPARGPGPWSELVVVRDELQRDAAGLRPMFDLLASTLQRLDLLAAEWASR
jgi:hypothetical protein